MCIKGGLENTSNFHALYDSKEISRMRAAARTDEHERWTRRELLLDLKRQGLAVAPELAVGDRAPGS